MKTTNKKQEKAVKLADILPEGLAESTVNKIAELVNKTINEEVAKKQKEIESKVFAFLEIKKAEIKESALKELQSENKQYRSLKVLEALKTCFALEADEKDISLAVDTVKTSNTKLDEKVKFLESEFAKVIEENKKVKTLNKTLADRNDLLSEKVKKFSRKIIGLTENVSEMSNKQPEPFKSSEKALVLNRKEEESESEESNSNPFINEDILRIANVK